MAKVSCRLVPDQDPDQILTAATDYLQKQLPDAVSVTIHKGHTGKS